MKRNPVKRTLDVRTKILALVSGSEAGVSSPKIAEKLRLSRQMVVRYLSEMVQAKSLAKTGSTKNARYLIYQEHLSSKDLQIQLVKNLKGLEEDTVFSEISLRLGLPKNCSQKTLAILKYAFTEMLNNAIDHSGSEKAEINFRIESKEVCFQIRDYGIGVYERVRKSFKLSDHFVAVEHLLKGKQTTDPSRHSGQGIFFTRRVADKFVLKSNEIELTVDNRKDDYFLKDVSKGKGTFVEFRISRQTRKELRVVFNEFSNDDFEFDKNSVRVKLTAEKNLVSRSEAKRLLVGLELYERIEFDFHKVKTIGQGFADEIFRVFQNSNPKIVLTYTHAEPAVAYMIERARKA